MARIFLCHASEDKKPVWEVYHHLAAIEGFEPWLDEEKLLPGELWEEEIPRALKASDFILIFFSRTSVAKRGYVQYEMKVALDAWEKISGLMIHTIPVRLDECEIPEPFRRYHYANLFDPRGLDRLVTALHRGLEQRGEQVSESLETPPVNSESTPMSSSLETEHALQNKPLPSASASIPEEVSKPPTWVLVVSVVSALAFLSLLFATAVFISDPTPFQIFIFRVLLGLAAAAFGATIPGFLRLELPIWGQGVIAATGALALFVLVYLVNPPTLVDSSPESAPKVVVTPGSWREQTIEQWLEEQWEGPR